MENGLIHRDRTESMIKRYERHNMAITQRQNHIQSEQKIEGSNKHILFNPSEVLIGRKCAINADEKLSIERKRKMSSDIKREISIEFEV